MNKYKIKIKMNNQKKTYKIYKVVIMNNQILIFLLLNLLVVAVVHHHQMIMKMVHMMKYQILMVKMMVIK